MVTPIPRLNVIISGLFVIHDILAACQPAAGPAHLPGFGARQCYQQRVVPADLSPNATKLKIDSMCLVPPPSGKTAVDVFDDFLSYLFHCRRSSIIGTHTIGHALWRTIEHDIQ